MCAMPRSCHLSFVPLSTNTSRSSSTLAQLHLFNTHFVGGGRRMLVLDRWTFIAWFYALVFFEKLLRWILKHFVGYHKETRRPYSLVNAMDPCFDGFSPVHKNASPSTLPKVTKEMGDPQHRQEFLVRLWLSSPLVN